MLFLVRKPNGGEGRKRRGGGKQGEGIGERWKRRKKKRREKRRGGR